MATGLGFGGAGLLARGRRAQSEGAAGMREWASQTDTLPELLFLCGSKLEHVPIVVKVGCARSSGELWVAFVFGKESGQRGDNF